MEQFSAYAHALASLAGFAIVVLILSPLSAIPKGRENIAPGGTPAGDYTNPDYRINRAYLNGTETLPAFVTVTLVAMLAGASPFWINLLASLVLVSRIVHVFVHLKGIGAPHAGPRSMAYVFGWVCMIGIGALGMIAAFS